MTDQLPALHDSGRGQVMTLVVSMQARDDEGPGWNEGWEKKLASWDE